MKDSDLATKGSRSRLDHVMLGSAPGPSSRWAQATGRTYDIRVDTYGQAGYSVSVNIDRIGKGTIGWICHRDGSFGAIAGIIIFSGISGQPDPNTDLHYEKGLLWPLPREYWIDGARLQLRGWQGSPFKPAPNQFQNGQEIRRENVVLLYNQLAGAVKDWLTSHTG
jgi:hypothetical protein